MGYKRFGCVGKNYEVAHFFFLTHSLIIIFLVGGFLAEKEWMTEKRRILLKSTSIAKFTTILWSEKVFLNQ